MSYLLGIQQRQATRRQHQQNEAGRTHHLLYLFFSFVLKSRLLFLLLRDYQLLEMLGGMRIPLERTRIYGRKFNTDASNDELKILKTELSVTLKLVFLLQYLYVNTECWKCLKRQLTVCPSLFLFLPHPLGLEEFFCVPAVWKIQTFYF